VKVDEGLREQVCSISVLTSTDMFNFEIRNLHVMLVFGPNQSFVTVVDASCFGVKIVQQGANNEVTQQNMRKERIQREQEKDST
jgi:hypothetical protein